MNIVTLIESAVNLISVSPAPTFLHGEKSLLNIKIDDVTIFPIIELFEPITSDDEILSGGGLQENYNILMFFGNKTTKTTLEDGSEDEKRLIVTEMRNLRTKFINALTSSSNPDKIRFVNKVRTEDKFHTTDADMVGVYLELNITPFFDTTSCP